jgi:cationic peptide transport system substrate-binding protein
LSIPGRQLYDRLLDVDPYTYRLVPELAESWEVLDNGATYRFHLRNNVPFQTTAWFKPTRNFNADDVIFTFGRIFNRDHPWHNVNGSSFPYFDSLQFADSVESVRKLDNHTVEFRLKRPDASFLWHLATHYASVMSAEYAAKLAQTIARNCSIGNRSAPVRSSWRSTARSVYSPAAPSGLLAR